MLKTTHPVVRMFTPKHISYDNIWDRGLLEYNTAQLSSLPNLLIAYQNIKVFHKILKHILPVFQTFTLHFLIVWRNPGYQGHQHIKTHLFRFSAQQNKVSILEKLFPIFSIKNQELWIFKVDFLMIRNIL